MSDFKFTNLPDVGQAKAHGKAKQPEFTGTPDSPVGHRTQFDRSGTPVTYRKPVRIRSRG